MDKNKYHPYINMRQKKEYIFFKRISARENKKKRNFKNIKLKFKKHKITKKLIKKV